MEKIHSIEEYRYYLDHGRFPDTTNKVERSIKEGLFIDNIYNELLDMVKRKQAIYIPGNVPSSKNSREIRSVYTGKSDCCNADYIRLQPKKYQCTKCGNLCKIGRRNILGYSKVCQEYIDSKGNEFLDKKIIFDTWNISFPIDIGLYFIRDSRRIFDGINAAQIIFDLIQKYKWVDNDHMDYLRHHDLGYHVGDNAGFILAILDFTPKFKNINICVKV